MRIQNDCKHQMSQTCVHDINILDVFFLSRNVVELFDLIEILVNQDRTESGCIISTLVYVYKCKKQNHFIFLVYCFYYP